MKQLREGYTTGTCAAAASLASVLWQTTGTCPHQVAVETPAGKTLYLEILPIQPFTCAVRKDAGDDPDETNGCLVQAQVTLSEDFHEIRFQAGAGVGVVTRKGLKLPVGEPAINPVPRQMIRDAIAPVLGNKGAVVTISIPGGEALAKKTFNPRLGIQGGLSILGTTGIVRPMSEAAVKDALCLELSMCRKEYGSACALVTGYAGERYLRERYPASKGKAIVLCSNYLGQLLDDARDMEFSQILLVGRRGKLCKPAADIMQLHSHIAGGQREILCTHSALAGADTRQIAQLYACNTTAEMGQLLTQFGLDKKVWQSVAEAVEKSCMCRVQGKIEIGVILLDEEDRVLARSQLAEKTERAWLKCSIH